MPINEARPILEQILCKCLARKHFRGKCPYAVEATIYFFMFDALHLYEFYIFERKWLIFKLGSSNGPRKKGNWRSQ